MNMCLQPPGYTYTAFLWIKYGRVAKKEKKGQKKRKSGEREKRVLIPAMLGYKKKVIPA